MTITLIKNCPIVSGGSLELIDGGGQDSNANNDVLKANSRTSLDVWATVGGSNQAQGGCGGGASENGAGGTT